MECEKRAFMVQTTTQTAKSTRGRNFVQKRSSYQYYAVHNNVLHNTAHFYSEKEVGHIQIVVLFFVP